MERFLRQSNAIMEVYFPITDSQKKQKFWYFATEHVGHTSVLLYETGVTLVTREYRVLFGG